MKIKHAINGGLAEVSDEYGQRLIDAGLWLPAEGAKPAAPAQPTPEHPEARSEGRSDRKVR